MKRLHCQPGGMLIKCFESVFGKISGAVSVFILSFALCTALLTVYVRMVLSGEIVIDTSLNSFKIPSLSVAERQDAFNIVSRQYRGVKTCSNDLSFQKRDIFFTNETDPLISMQRSSRSTTDFVLTVIYEAKDGNMLTPENLNSMHKAERQIYSFIEDREGISPNLDSILKYIYPPDGVYVTDDLPVLQHEYIVQQISYAAQKKQAEGLPPPLGSEFYKFVSPDCTARNLKARFVVSEIYVPTSISDSTQAAYYSKLDELSNDNVVVVYYTADYKDYELDTLINHDLKLCLYAFLFVTCYMLFHTGSLFLTMCGVLNITFSFPVAYFIYRNIWGNTKSLPILTVAAAFVIIGIAVDDIFVFVDMFKQSGNRSPLKFRVKHTIRTAAKATLFTSITSFASFWSNTVSSIEALYAFGALTAFLVLANYILVITFMLSALTIWARFVEPIERKCKCGNDTSGRNTVIYEEVGETNDMELGSMATFKLADLATNPSDGDGDDEELLVLDEVQQNNAEDTAAESDSDFESNTEVHKSVPPHERGFSQRILWKFGDPIVGPLRIPIVIFFFCWFGVALFSATRIEPEESVTSIARPGSNLFRLRQLTKDMHGFSLGMHSLNLPDIPNAKPVTQGPSTTSLQSTFTKPNPSPSPSPLPSPSPPSPSPSPPSPSPSPPSPSPSPRTTPPNPSPPSPSPSPPSPSPSPPSPSTTSPITPSPSPSPSGPTPSPPPPPSTTLSPPPKTPSPAPKTPSPAPPPSPPHLTTPMRKTTAKIPTTKRPRPSHSTTKYILPTNIPTGTPSPRKRNTLNNVKVSLTFGLSAPFVDRFDSNNESSWKPIFDKTLAKEGIVPSKNAYGFGINTNYEKDLQGFVRDFFASPLITSSQNSSWSGAVSNGIPTGVTYVGLYECQDATMFWMALDQIYTTIDASTGFEKFVEQWSELDSLVASLTHKYPQVGTPFLSSSEATVPYYKVVAVSGAIWGIGLSLTMCLLAVALVTMNIRLLTIIMFGVTTNVVSVMAVFNWIGWGLGAVEAITLSIVVGTSVDYLIHLAEAFVITPNLVTHDNALAARKERVLLALSSIGIPIISSAITTIGSVSILTLCLIGPLRKFGVILTTVTASSLIVTMVLTPALLVTFGPQRFRATWRRTMVTWSIILFIVGVAIASIYIMKQSGIIIRGPSGVPIF
eukprot:m.63222 g.63222  ORF g.63222 m.63222 type:complete len:1178 (+) comp11570_c0_seq2:321-3854(+)